MEGFNRAASSELYRRSFGLSCCCRMVGQNVGRLLCGRRTCRSRDDPLGLFTGGRPRSATGVAAPFLLFDTGADTGADAGSQWPKKSERAVSARIRSRP